MPEEATVKPVPAKFGHCGAFLGMGKGKVEPEQGCRRPVLWAGHAGAGEESGIAL